VAASVVDAAVVTMAAVVVTEAEGAGFLTLRDRSLCTLPHPHPHPHPD
jgi:hypothetical protein